MEKNAEKMWSNMSEEVRRDYGEDLFRERVKLMKSYVTGGVSYCTVVYSSITIMRN